MMINPSLWRLQIAIVGTTLLFFPPFWNLDDLRYYLFHIPKFFFLSFVMLTLIEGLWRHSKRAAWFTLSWSEVGLFGYLAIAFLSATCSKVTWSIKIEWLARYCLPILVYLCARQNRETNRDAIEKTILASATLLALFAWCEALGWFSFQSPRAPVGSLGSRNYVALYLTVCFPLVLVRTSQSTRTWIWFVVIFVCSTAIVFSRSRAAWGILGLQALCGMAMFIFSAGRRPFRQRVCEWVPVAGTLGLSAVAATFFPWRGLHWREAAPYSSSLRRILDFSCGSGRFRLSEYAIGRAIFDAQPLLGIGPESWRTQAPLFTHSAANEHATTLVLSIRNSPNSDFVRILSETGLLGAGLLGTGILLFFWQFFRKTERARFFRSGTPAYVLSLLSLLGFGFVDTPFCRPEILCLVPVLICLATVRRHPSPVSLPASVAAWFACAAAIFCVGVYGLIFASCFPLVTSLDLNHQLEAQRIFPLPSRDLLIGKLASTDAEHCNRAREAMRRMVTDEPNNYLGHAYEARCQMFFGDRHSAAMEYNRAMLLEPDDEGVRREYRSWEKNKPAVYALGSSAALFDHRECF